ncbi:hypothetical protein NM208_g10107 [Fusarium decemcellulare]|uniref:Uncharacterized protein n=1 Tax=Fusarium decemcellulare TaxID=57161 RepID=A0ACC1RZ14_9HYPO|nr:hypothetical protein NM208_g10107 [Fusarium decemcellulare]
MTSMASELGFENLALFLDCDQPSQMVDPQPSCDPAPGLGSRKRKHHDSSGEDLSQKVEIQSKKPKSDIQYSCPYRRRNPRLFNVRDFHACANRSFSNMSFVKRHVMANHQSKDFASQCVNCKVWLSKQAFDCHSMNQSCSSLPPPVFDEHDKGITQEMETKLRDRRAKTKVLTWEGLWRTIFPDNADIKTPYFKPILEHNEAEELFYRALPDPDYNAMFQLRGVASNSDALDAAPLQAQAFPPSALEPCMAGFQYPSDGLDMGLQNGLPNSKAPENHL